MATTSVGSPRFSVRAIRESSRGVTFDLPPDWLEEFGLGPSCQIEPVSRGRLRIRLLTRQMLPNGMVKLSWNQPELKMQYLYRPDLESHCYELTIEARHPVMSVVVTIRIDEALR